LEGLGMENVGIFNGHLVYFTVIWYNVWQFGVVSGPLVYLFFPFWYVQTQKNLATPELMARRVGHAFDC
jgi:hypothetical protein